MSEGQVSLLSAKDNKKEVMKINEGQVFGDIEFFFEFEFRIVYAKPANKDCKVFILDHQVAKDIFTRFDDFEAKQFQEGAKKKYDIIKNKISVQEIKYMNAAARDNAARKEREAEDMASELGVNDPEFNRQVLSQNSTNMSDKACQTVSNKNEFFGLRSEFVCEEDVLVCLFDSFFLLFNQFWPFFDFLERFGSAKNQ